MTETRNQDGPECPHCGEVTAPDEAFFYTDDRLTHECGYCGKEYEFTHHRVDTWRAAPIDSGVLEKKPRHY